ncbi:MAG: hypothetical protein ABIP30_02750 [Ferruginibacter sp.]
MKKTILMGAFALLGLTQAFAQNNEEITHRNSWLKAGLSAGVPVGDLSNYSSIAAGLELSGQYLVNPHFGIGIASGYTNYFAKKGFKDFGTIPVGLLLRYYPKSEGFFAGVDGGYSFITNSNGGPKGGAYVKPQLGYHNYSWNFYGFYNQVFLKTPSSDLQTVGIAATYNIRFK